MSAAGMPLGSALRNAAVLAAALLGSAGFEASAQGTAPSFDCTAASGRVEELICKDAGLAALDRSLARVLEQAAAALPPNAADEQRAVQRGWIEVRNECASAADVRACTENAYRVRIAELAIASGQAGAPKNASFDCGVGAKPFLARFYAGTDPASAVLRYGDEQTIAFAAAAASGTRYTAAGVEFREHQGMATIDWYGTRLECMPRTDAVFPAR
jgi:uncharacterized protein